MTYLSKRSEYKYFVVETGEDYTMVFTNEATYEDMVDGVLEPFFLNSEDNKRLNEYLGGILTKPAELYGSKDGEEIIEKIHKGIYEALGETIKKFVISLYGNPERYIGI